MADDLNTALGIQTPEAPQRPDDGTQTPSQFLDSVRAQTCSSTLRGIIQFVSIFTIILVVVCAAYLAVEAGADGNNWLLVLCVAVGILSAFLIIALYLGALLLVDIADMLIQQSCHSRPSAHVEPHRPS